MNTSRTRGGRPRLVRVQGRPPSLTSGRSKAAPEARLPPPPRDRLPSPPEIRIAGPENIPAEAPSTAGAPAPQDRQTSQLPPGEGTTRRAPSGRQLLRQALSSPGAARHAFLLREVLGPPVSLRTEAHDRPS